MTIWYIVTVNRVQEEEGGKNTKQKINFQEKHNKLRLK